MEKMYVVEIVDVAKAKIVDREGVFTNQMEAILYASKLNSAPLRPINLHCVVVEVEPDDGTPKFINPLVDFKSRGVSDPHFAKLLLNSLYGRYVDSDSVRQGGDFDVVRTNRDGSVVVVMCERLEFDQALQLAAMRNEHDAIADYSVVRRS